MINQALYIGITVLIAWYHSTRFKKHKTISHFWWGLWAVLIALLFAFINPWYFPVMISWRAVLFSPVLNKFRGHALSYMSPYPVSIIDKLERRLFKNFTTRTVVYVTLLITFEVFLLWGTHWIDTVIISAFG